MKIHATRAQYEQSTCTAGNGWFVSELLGRIRSSWPHFSWLIRGRVKNTRASALPSPLEVKRKFPEEILSYKHHSDRYRSFARMYHTRRQVLEPHWGSLVASPMNSNLTGKSCEKITSTKTIRLFIFQSSSYYLYSTVTPRPLKLSADTAWNSSSELLTLS